MIYWTSYISVYKMCEGYGHGMRSFLTKEERIEILKEYKSSLENEAKGVSERIKELEKEK